ncbi:MAG: FtsH protease activity modulator HflK [Sterolibacteriaceae bacterium]|uniref:Protein HflK n=1 Tax=Candidatus Methylophosphatis roskildensis TaxID=2899263 RepID=A0A9D7E8W3_9PROT|nr:FtsH protease activity modulator HflK [Candidatus Methylophosphatis roskildensis]MBK7237349.1 FtsH protease activity modulator HflK [Sterolibacteriaceae bacterium]
MSLNDPQWGRGNGNKGGSNQGPPDLEELWRDVNRRITGIFGRKGGGSDGGGNSGNRPPFSFRNMGGGIGVLLIVILLIWLASGFYTVDASQRGVVLQFGRYNETTDPGLRWRLPYPIQSHELVNLTGVRTVEIGYRGGNKVLKEALMLTDDENIINIQFAVQYILNDPKNYLFTNRSPDEAVVQAAETAVREIVGKSKMDFVLYEGREQVAARAAQAMQLILDRYQTGIQISKVTMQNAQPPDQVQAAFDDAVKAGQDRERQKSEGQAYANDVIPKAKGTSARLIEEANGYSQRVVATADGDASRFKQVLTEYSRAPEVTRQRMYIETMQQVMSNSSKIMIDARSSGNLLYLPLDKLMMSAGAAAAQNSQSIAPSEVPLGQRAQVQLPEPQVAPPKADVPPSGSREDYRSREAMRQRDR